RGDIARVRVAERTEVAGRHNGVGITVVGAGILGTWQALLLARAGHRVRLIERSPPSLDHSASLFAGAMLAPFCEAEASEPALLQLGARGLRLWQREGAGGARNGTHAGASPRDRPELMRFARATTGHEAVDKARLEDLEPDLKGRFSNALFYPGEGHVVPRAALDALREAAQRAGAEICFEESSVGDGGG